MLFFLLFFDYEKYLFADTILSVCLGTLLTTLNIMESISNSYGGYNFCLLNILIFRRHPLEYVERCSSSSSSLKFSSLTSAIAIGCVSSLRVSFDSSSSQTELPSFATSLDQEYASKLSLPYMVFLNRYFYAKFTLLYEMSEGQYSALGKIECQKRFPLGEWCWGRFDECDKSWFCCSSSRPTLKGSILASGDQYLTGNRMFFSGSTAGPINWCGLGICTLCLASATLMRATSSNKFMGVLGF